MADSSNPVQQNSIVYYVSVLPSGNPPSEIVADASQVGPALTHDQLGMNGLIQISDSANSANEPLFSSAGVGLIRWPGGEQADVYHWQTNTFRACSHYELAFC